MLLECFSGVCNGILITYLLVCVACCREFGLLACVLIVVFCMEFVVVGFTVLL